MTTTTIYHLITLIILIHIARIDLKSRIIPNYYHLILLIPSIPLYLSTDYMPLHVLLILPILFYMFGVMGGADFKALMVITPALSALELYIYLLLASFAISAQGIRYKTNLPIFLALAVSYAPIVVMDHFIPH